MVALSRANGRDRIEASKNMKAVRTVMQTVLGPLPRSETLWFPRREGPLAPRNPRAWRFWTLARDL